VLPVPKIGLRVNQQPRLDIARCRRYPQ
ncbi:hypothetical protein D030_1836B, partial [Vibrio parahaemolyticus AQ3810]